LTIEVIENFNLKMKGRSCAPVALVLLLVVQAGACAAQCVRRGAGA
jgi:hypothetical protein